MFILHWCTQTSVFILFVISNSNVWQLYSPIFFWCIVMLYHPSYSSKTCDNLSISGDRVTDEKANYVTSRGKYEKRSYEGGEFLKDSASLSVPTRGQVKSFNFGANKTALPRI